MRDPGMLKESYTLKAQTQDFRLALGYRRAIGEGQQLSQQQAQELAAAESRLLMCDGLEMVDVVDAIVRGGLPIDKRPDRVVDTQPMQSAQEHREHFRR